MNKHTNPIITNSKKPNSPPQGSTKPPNRTQAQAIEKKISRRQFFFFIVQTQIGVGILSLPNELHQVAKQDGWISLLIGGGALTLVIFVLWYIAKSYPEDNFFQINNKIFSKWPGKVISFIYVMYFIGVSILIILLFAKMISLWVLPNTPFWVLALILIIVGFYLTNGGILVISRFYTMVSFLLIMLVALITYSIKEVHLMYLLPIGGSGVSKILSGAMDAILSFFGFFVSLVIYNRVQGKPRQKLRTMFYAHFFVMFYYLFTILVCYTFFSTEEIKVVPEPLLFMLKSFELPVIARIDLFFISIWIVSVATSFTTYVFMANVGLQEIFQTKKVNLFSLIICTIALGVAVYYGYDMIRVKTFSNFIVKIGIWLSVIAPFFILLSSIIVRKIKKEET